MCAWALNTSCPPFCPLEPCASARLTWGQCTWRRWFLAWWWNCRRSWNPGMMHAFTEPQHLPVSVDVYFVVLPLHTHQTPKLFSSIAEGNLPSVLECLPDGQCADVCDSSGLSALYAAVIREHPDIACALIRAKATHRRLHGATPGFWHCQCWISRWLLGWFKSNTCWRQNCCLYFLKILWKMCLWLTPGSADDHSSSTPSTPSSVDRMAEDMMRVDASPGAGSVRARVLNFSLLFFAIKFQLLCKFSRLSCLGIGSLT